MRRAWPFIIFALITSATVWWLSPSKSPAPRITATVVHPERTPAQVLTQTRVKPTPRPVEKTSTLRLPAHARVESREREVLSQHNRRYKFLSDVAVIRVQDLPPGVEVLSKRQTWVMIHSSDVPAGVTAMDVIERQDNRQLGIFTGVMKATLKTPTDASAVFAACEAEVKTSYPHIKSFLLLPKQSSNYSEFKECLSQSGLFKRLDWEILEAGRLTR